MNKIILKKKYLTIILFEKDLINFNSSLKEEQNGNNFEYIFEVSLKCEIKIFFLFKIDFKNISNF